MEGWREDGNSVRQAGWTRKPGQRSHSLNDILGVAGRNFCGCSWHMRHHYPLQLEFA